MVGTVGLLRLAFLAKADVARRCLDGKGRVLHASSFLRRQLTVAICEVEGRTRIGEDGGRVAPVEHQVEEETEG